MEDIFKIPTKDHRIAPGRILVASPELNDGIFSRSVVLITEHGEEGSMGFMLNKPTNTPMQDVLKDMGEQVGSLRLMLGGPVDLSMLHFIHAFGQLIPDSQALSTSLYWGGDFNAMLSLLGKELVLSNQVMFLVGYAGWGAGQLEEELSNWSWAITDLGGPCIFSNPNSLWRTAVEQLGQRYAVWLNYPESPGMN